MPIHHPFLQIILILAVAIGAFHSSSSVTTRAHKNAPPPRINSHHKSHFHDANALTIHLIPHSHCDPGWIHTVSHYFTENVSHILSNTLAQLLVSPQRRFQWNEIVYFKMWYEALDDDTKAQFRLVLSRGQWEFVGGGFTQNDEATLTHSQIMEQMTLGHLYLKETFKEDLPPIRASWQVDPFGHSKIFAKLLKMMRFEWHVIDRVDERLKYQFRNPYINGSGVFEREKAFEFYWQLGGVAEGSGEQSIFTHVLDHMYVAPQYCYNNYTYSGENNIVCTGFDFEDGGEGNPPLTPSNAGERATQFLNYVHSEVSPYYRTSQIMIPMGHDFSYQDAQVWFVNMDRLIEEINNDETGVYGGAKLRYSTVSEYFDAVMAEKEASDGVGEDGRQQDENSVQVTSPVHSTSHSAAATTTSTTTPASTTTQITFPTRPYSDPDFFPFTNCWEMELSTYNNCVAYWSGYFTSHPGFKRQVRQYSALLRAADLIHVYVLSRKALMPVSVDWEEIFNHLTDLREAVALATHHDAITGTSKQSVMDDYMRRLDEAAKPVEELAQHLLSLLIATQVTQIPSLNIAYRSRLEYTEDASVDGIMPIVVFNPLAWQRVDYISVLVPDEYQFNVSTIDENTKHVVSVVAERVGQEILFMAQAPPVGYNTYFLSAEKVGVSGYDSIGSDVGIPGSARASFQTPNPTQDDPQTPASTGLTPIITLCNDFMEASFNLHDGKSLPYVLKTIHLLDAEKTYRISESLLSYESYEDGAYIFRPQDNAKPIHIDPAQVQLTSLKLHGNVKEIEQQLTPTIKQKFRVYNGVKKNSADMSYFVEMTIESTCGETQEIVSRFTTDIDSKDTFFTDSNGYELVPRKRHTRFQDEWQPNVLSGNFYPMTTQTLIRDDDTQLTIYSNQAVGVSSQVGGTLEVMVNRRTKTDDHRGLDAPLNVTTPSVSTFRISIMSVDAADSLRSQQTLFFEHPVVTFSHSNLVDIVPRPSFHIADYYKLFSTYGVQMNPLPENVHLLTMRNLHFENGTALLRLHHIFEPHQDLVHSKPVTLFLQQVFDKYKFVDLYETSLTAAQDLSENLMQMHRGGRRIESDPGGDEDPTKIALDPLQIRTFRLTLSVKDGPQTWNWLSFVIGGSVTAMVLLMGATCVLCIYKYSFLQEQRSLGGLKSVNIVDEPYEEILDDSDE